MIGGFRRVLFRSMELAVAQCLGPCAIAVQIVGVHSLFALFRREAMFAVGELRDDWGIRREGLSKCKGHSGKQLAPLRAPGNLLRRRQNDDCPLERDRGPTGKLDRTCQLMRVWDE